MTLDKLQKDFKELAVSGKLAQGYIFFGSRDGKEDFAKRLSNFLENKDWQSSSDLRLDFLEVGKGIDDIRAAAQFLWQKPLVSSRKTLLIPQAENLTIEAQNAILKISEDSPPHALLIITVNDPESLLPTLTSRFQKIYFGNEMQTGGRARSAVEEFFKASKEKRKDLIKELANNDSALEEFAKDLMVVLSRDAVSNYSGLKEFLKRWSNIKRYNTNRRLQLEAALLNLKKI